MTLSEVIDDHFLEKYRGLLDAEDAAFDELEHAHEDGDRTPYEVALGAWQVGHRKEVELPAATRRQLQDQARSLTPPIPSWLGDQPK